MTTDSTIGDSRRNERDDGYGEVDSEQDPLNLGLVDSARSAVSSARHRLYLETGELTYEVVAALDVLERVLSATVVVESDQLPADQEWPFSTLANENTSLTSFLVWSALSQTYLIGVPSQMWMLESLLAQLKNDISGQSSGESIVRSALVDVLDSANAEVTRIRSEVHHLPTYTVVEVLDDALARLQSRIGAEVSELRAKLSSDRAERAAEAAEEAASTSGTASLAKHFDELATTERNQSWFWISCSFVAAALALWAAVEHFGSIGTMEAVDILRKAMVGLPVVAFFGITTHEAAIHRANALWCAHMAVQLKTLRAFTSDLDDKGRAVRVRFAQVVFSGPPDLGSRRKVGTETITGGELERAVLDRFVRDGPLT